MIPCIGRGLTVARYDAKLAALVRPSLSCRAVPIHRYVEHLLTQDGESGRPNGARRGGSLVTDAHRTLFEGGVFLDPGDDVALAEDFVAGPR